MSSISWNTLCFSSTDLEDRLDDEVDALEVGGVGGRRDAGQQRVGLLLRGLAPLERLGLELLRVVLALLRGLDA